MKTPDTGIEIDNIGAETISVPIIGTSPLISSANGAETC
jgi:hypothetical protein